MTMKLIGALHHPTPPNKPTEPSKEYPAHHVEIVYYDRGNDAAELSIQELFETYQDLPNSKGIEGFLSEVYIEVDNGYTNVTARLSGGEKPKQVYAEELVDYESKLQVYENKMREYEQVKAAYEKTKKSRDLNTKKKMYYKLQKELKELGQI